MTARIQRNRDTNALIVLPNGMHDCGVAYVVTGTVLGVPRKPVLPLLSKWRKFLVWHLDRYSIN